MELGLRLGPQLFHGQDRLTRLGPAVIEVSAHDGGLFPVPAGADTEQEPAAAEQIEGGDLLGQQQRVPFRDQRDARAQIEGRGDSGRPREGDERIDEVRVALRDDPIGGARETAGALHGHDRMLGAPQRLEAERLGGARHEGDVHVVSGQGHRDTDVHGLLLVLARGVVRRRSCVVRIIGQRSGGLQETTGRRRSVRAGRAPLVRRTGSC